MLPDMRDEAQLRAAFRWAIPQHYNIGVDVCDRWAMVETDRPAIFEVAPSGAVKTATFGQIRDASNQLANALTALGITRGDRVAILLPQAIEVAQTHVAVYKLGAIALPLAALFGVDALAYRLEDAGARVLVTNAAGLEKVRKIPALVTSTRAPASSSR